MSHGHAWSGMAWNQSTSMWRTTSRSPWSLGVDEFSKFPTNDDPSIDFHQQHSSLYLLFYWGKTNNNLPFGVRFLHFFATHKMVILEMLFWRVYSILQYNIRNNVFLFIVYFVDWLKRNDPGFHSRFWQRQYPAWRNSCGCPGGCLGIVAGQRSP